MNATWKCWLNRLMNRGAGAVRALGFTTRNAGRTLGARRLGRALGVVALSSALGGSAWAQEPMDEGVIRLRSGAESIDEAAVRLQDRSASASFEPQAAQAQYVQGSHAPPGVYGMPPAGPPRPRMADGYAPSYDTGVGYAMTQDVERILYRVGNTALDIYGTSGGNSGSTNFNAFIPLASDGANSLWYFQPRAAVTNVGRGIANAGLGYRVYMPEQDRTWSSTFWWDGDGGHHAWYNQLGAHFSSVGRYLSWRGGFAIPIGSTTDEFGQSISDIFFMNSNIGFDVATQVETAYKRFDLEAATPLPYFGRYGVELGVGVYHLTAQGAQDATGISGRIEAQVTEDFWINGLLTSDRVFGGNASINMEFTLPDGRPSKWFRPNSPRDALLASDKRNYRVAAGISKHFSQGVAINPETGDPITVAHINPNLTTTGDGTVQNAFNSILAFESLADVDQAAYDIIWVQGRTDGSDTNLNTTITLFDRQRLLGNGTMPSGNVHRFNALVNGILETNLILPGQPTGTTVPMPLLSNSGAPGLDVVRLANLNEVAGFQIDGTGTGAGISGTGIDGFHLHDLTITRGTEGIVITSDTSALLGFARENYGVITDTTITGGTGRPARAGISVTHVDGTLDLLVENNTVSGFRGEDANSNGIINPGDDVNGNGLLDPGIGIEITARDTGVIVADGNTVRRTGIRTNTTSANGTNIQLAAVDGGEFNAMVVDNDATGNLDSDSAGFVVIADDGEMVLSTATGNTFSGNAGDGALLIARNGGHLVVPQFEPATPSGFTDLNGNGVRDLGFTGNDIQNNGGAGIRVVADGAGSVAEVSFTGNTIENNATDGIIFQADDSGVIDVGQLQQNDISGHPGAFIRVAGDGGVINLGIIEGTIFDRSVTGGAGILFDASNADISGIIRNNQFLGSTANNDLTFGIGGEIRGGTLDLTIVDNYFNGNADAAIGLILGESDTRIPPGTGTPLEGEAVQAKLVITDNIIVATREGNNPRFDGQGIAIITDGQAQLPGGPTDPTSDVTTAAFLEGLIAENIIGVDPTREGVDLNDPSTWDVADGNAGAGIYFELNGDTGIIDLADIGSPVDDPELFGMVVGAYTYQGRSYQGNLIGNNLEGIQVRRNGTAIIDNFEINGNVIENNLNDGIDIVARGGLPSDVFEVLDFDIFGNVIRNNGRLSDGTLGITGRGIQLRGEDLAVMEVNIAENLIEGNWNGGIEARTATATHLFTGRDDIFGGAGGSDAVIYGVWEENVIRNNGILVAENANGNGINDLLTAGHGIALGRIDVIDFDNPGRIIEGYNNGGVLIDTNGDGIRDSEATLVIQNNVITGNGRDGIHAYFDKSRVLAANAGVIRTSRVNILSNDITNNGDDGFNLHNPLASDVFFNFNNNLVTGNGVYSGVYSVALDGGNTLSVIGDGVEIVTSGAANTFLTASGNRIKENNGRGVNILTAESGYLDTEWANNNISANAREGFYMVNAPLNATVVTRLFTVNNVPDRDSTYSRANYSTGYGYSGTNIASWHADMDSNHEMFRYGVDTLNFPAGNTPNATVLPFLIDYVGNLPLDAPVTDLLFTNNIVNGNGGVVPDADGEEPYSTAGGFVMRVGSATVDFTTMPSPIPAVGLPPAIDPSVPIPGLVGGVRARVQNNLFSGNTGRDFLIDGFIATEPPRVDVAADPLIRIDLVFNNNRGGSIDVEFSAFYENTAPNPAGFSDANEKSPPEVFGDGNEGRLRNVTRNLDWRIFDNGTDPPTWRPYPGLGSRTLRVQLLPGAGNYGPFGIGNNQFDLIYSSFFFWEEVGDADPTFITP